MRHIYNGLINLGEAFSTACYAAYQRLAEEIADQVLPNNLHKKSKEAQRMALIKHTRDLGEFLDELSEVSGSSGDITDILKAKNRPVIVHANDEKSEVEEEPQVDENMDVEDEQEGKLEKKPESVLQKEFKQYKEYYHRYSIGLPERLQKRLGIRAKNIPSVPAKLPIVGGFHALFCFVTGKSFGSGFLNGQFDVSGVEEREEAASEKKSQDSLPLRVFKGLFTRLDEKAQCVIERYGFSMLLFKALEQSDADKMQYYSTVIAAIIMVQKGIIMCDKDKKRNTKGYSALFNLSQQMLIRVARRIISDETLPFEAHASLANTLRGQRQFHIQQLEEQLPENHPTKELMQALRREYPPVNGDDAFVPGSMALAKLAEHLLAMKEKKFAKQYKKEHQYLITNVLSYVDLEKEVQPLREEEPKRTLRSS